MRRISDHLRYLLALEWACTKIDDNETASFTCEFCGYPYVRYIHEMQADTGEIINVGCICAGHLEDDIAGARDRERRFKNRQKRRDKFPHLKRWKRSRHGNPWIEYAGYRVTIFPVEHGFKAHVSNRANGVDRYSRRTYQSPYVAKVAAFDFMTLCEERTDQRAERIEGKS